MTERQDAFLDVLQRATKDAEYREALKEDPTQVLADAGVAVSPDVDYEVIEDTPDKVHIILPPMEKDLGVETLEARATKSALACTPGEGGMVTLQPCIVA